MSESPLVMNRDDDGNDGVAACRQVKRTFRVDAAVDDFWHARGCPVDESTDASGKACEITAFQAVESQSDGVTIDSTQDAQGVTDDQRQKFEKNHEPCFGLIFAATVVI